MTQKELDAMTGIEQLRLIVQNMDHCCESFLDPFTAEQVVQIGRMHLLSKWDFYPDQWTARQVKEALQGIPPQWTYNERPKYGEYPRDAKGEVQS